MDVEKMMQMITEIIRKSYVESGYAVECENFDTNEIMLPSHDGKKLRTVIYKPRNREADFPVVVQRSCYPMMEKMLQLHAEELTRRGFAFVYQMCRGTGGSKGEWEPNVNDRDDGLALMNWLNAEPWVRCMGYQGASYLAFTGWVMADALPEKVKSLYLTVYGTDRHTSAYKDGLFRQDILTSWAMGNAGRVIEADYLESCKFRPQINVDTEMWGGRLDWYRDWITSTSRTAPYWNDGFWKMLRDIPGKMKVPVYIGEGWYDHHLGSALKGYESLSEESKKHTVVRIGPWNHSFMPAISGHKEQKNGNGNETLNALWWFTETLKKGEKPEAKIHGYVIGADKWREWSSYPFETKKEVKFFLGTGGDLLPSSEHGGEISYVYDPINPVMSHGGESLFATQPEIGSLLQPEPNFRSDVISFVSAPLERDIEIIGKIKANLFVSSDADDTAFTIKLMEVFENGEAYNIRNGVTTLAYRNGSESRVSYTAGEIVEAEIICWDVAWLLKKGSCLRLDVSSSNFPEYAVHPNVAGVWSEIIETKPAKQTIYFGSDYPARVTLPLN